ncbi:pilus assembly protein PilP [Glaciecola sp. 2405UD65-10]|uniref:pilus assembly protein PilP n=1 Tax=Glaciecola sp. 2405UD65-10 TaxID=3397244 RepID=UPI003B5AC3D2
MIVRVVVIAVLSLLLSACGSNIDDLILYTQQVRANTQVSIEPYPEFKALPNVSYGAADLRSPFQRSIRAANEAPEQQQTNCPQINLNRPKQGLEKYGLDALTMTGVFTSNGRKYALISANDGSLHKVTRNSYLGLFHGRVKQITNKEILITEMLPDGAGCYKSKDTTLIMSSLLGERNDV